MDFLFGLRRMMGLTTPAQEEDYYARQAEAGQQMLRQPTQVQPGTALRERQDTMGAAMEELRRQSGVAPAAPAAQPAPATPTGMRPDALRNINPIIPTPTVDEIPGLPKRKMDPSPGFIRG